MKLKLAKKTINWIGSTENETPENTWVLQLTTYDHGRVTIYQTTPSDLGRRQWSKECEKWTMQKTRFRRPKPAMTAATVGSFSTERTHTGVNSLPTTHSFQYLSITGGVVEKNCRLSMKRPLYYSCFDWWLRVRIKHQPFNEKLGNKNARWSAVPGWRCRPKTRTCVWPLTLSCFTICQICRCSIFYPPKADKLQLQ